MALQVNGKFNSEMNLMFRWVLGATTPSLLIYQGAVPTSAAIGDWSTYETSRSGDLLATLPNAQVPNGAGSVYFDSGNPTPTNASATGTATWGAWKFPGIGSGGAIVGTVTEAGGGGLFIIDSVNITSGNLVTIIGFRMTW